MPIEIHHCEQPSLSKRSEIFSQVLNGYMHTFDTHMFYVCVAMLRVNEQTRVYTNRRVYIRTDACIYEQTRVYIHICIYKYACVCTQKLLHYLH
jgi:hypothetical protein